MVALLLAALALAAPDEAAPTDQTLIYYNARMALREEQPLEAVKLWLLRNAVEDQTERLSPHDDDFGSVAWAALGALGVCPDGHANDTDGAGLWPLALQNWVVRNMNRRTKPRRPRPFDAFPLGRQQRFIAIGDVPSYNELRTLRLFRGACYRPRLALLNAGELPNADLSDRKLTARLLLYLLHRSRDTLDFDVVRGWAAVEARLFDLHLQVTALAARQARQREREVAQRGRLAGLSRASIEALRGAAPAYQIDSEEETARILRECPSWPVSEWMALSPDRRLFLFDHARDFSDEPAALDALALGILDTLVAAGDGAEAERWIPRHAGDPVAIWGGLRGQRLLALDPTSGFDERAVISLHRGVAHLAAGDRSAALQALSYAMRHAPDSKDSEATQNLSRRWLSYVAAQFQITDELVVTMQELVPRREYNLILEDLMWRSAFHADSASFERGIQAQRGRGALERRLGLLRPLSRGDLRSFFRRVDKGLKDNPSETLRFLGQLVARLELEEGAIRANHLDTLDGLRQLLRPLSEDEEASGRQARLAGELLARCQAIMEGLGSLGLDPTTRDTARRLSPDGEVFAGSVRLAPSDPLPWPFRAAQVPAPPVFTPLDLVPVEWLDADGELVFGWSIRE